MNKILISLFGVVTLCVLTSVVSAMPNLSLSKAYLSFDTGYSWGRVTKTNFPGARLGRSNLVHSPVFDFGVGYHVNRFIRLAATVSYRSGYTASISDAATPFPNVGTATAKSLAGMLNAYWDIKKFGRFVPYIGAGIGITRNSLSPIISTTGGVPYARIPSGHNVSFVWQGSVGTAVCLMKNLTLDVGYRYIDLGKSVSGNNIVINLPPAPVVFPGRFTGRLHSNELQLGVRYNFL